MCGLRTPWSTRAIPVILLVGVWTTTAIFPRLLGAAEQQGPSRELAEMLVQRAGFGTGVCAVLGHDGRLPVDLAASSRLLVHVREPDREKVRQLIALASSEGFGIDRLAAEAGDLDRLPYADNMVDLVLAAGVGGDRLGQLSLPEILRVLRPEGVAIVGKSLHSPGPDVTPQALAQWAGSASAQGVETWQDSLGAWVILRKPALVGIDEWTHWEHGPDNNPVSSDQIIRAPYMTQYMAGPLYIGMPSITTAAGGRTFLAIGHIAHHRREWETLYTLIARNGYNGTILWERKLPPGYAVHRSSFIASKDTFYMIDSDRCLMLDPQTGSEQGEIRLPGISGDWKWMVMRDGILFVLTGPKDRGTQITRGDRSFGGWSWADLSPEYYGDDVPIGYGNTLSAYDMREKQLRWSHAEDKLIDSRAMALRDNKLYLLCPDEHLRCLEAATGEIIWTNSDPNVRNLVAEPGKRLTSTPGFRTACLAVATPQALIIQGQTRMNVVAISAEDGYVLWTKRKITNNPNAIYVDGKVILGVGPGGSHVALDPVSGEVQEDLKFRKAACTRLTASADSFFCRGEGTLRFDRESGRVLIDGGQRPACNDGALPANGLLYLGPWQCDCNLSLIGNIAKCSAGDFRFDRLASEEERLERFDDWDKVQPLEIHPRDWPTYRADNVRSASTAAPVQWPVAEMWRFQQPQGHIPTAPVSAGGLVLVASSDGKVRAFEAASGEVRWEFATPCPIKSPPSVWEGRAYIGSGDGYVYALEAGTGRLLWKFRAAPVERYIMVYGNLCSTWPVNTGVLVADGVAYFAAGIIDHDGTYVYALDARSGEIRWQNNKTGHLSPELRKGVSAMGNLALLGNQLLLAGGNQVSPAVFDIATGECSAKPFAQGQPKANGGQFVGAFRDVCAITGGRILYSVPENVSTKGSFVAYSPQHAYQLNSGGVPPSWDDKTLAMVNFKYGKLTCCDSSQVAGRIKNGPPQEPRQDARRFFNLAQSLQQDGSIRWQTDLGQEKFETVSLAVTPNAVVAVLQYQQRVRSQPQWFVVALRSENGNPMFQHELDREPLPGGLLVDRSGRVVVTMLDGTVLGLGNKG